MVKHYYGAIRNKPDIRDFHIRHFFAMEDLPQASNFVSEMPAVRQQFQVGSCVAFAITTCQQFQGNWTEPLSPHFVYYETLKAEGRLGQDGLEPRDAAQTLVNLGVPSESLCPYGDMQADQTPCESQQVLVDAALRKAQSFASCTSLEEVELVLSKKIPVLLAMPVFQNWETPDVDATGEIPMPEGQEIGGHGIAACGYDQTLGEIIFENSWGTQWAAQSPYRAGFGTLQEAYIDEFLKSGDGSATVLTDVAAPAPAPNPNPIINKNELVLAQGFTDSAGKETLGQVLYRYPLA